MMEERTAPAQPGEEVRLLDILAVVVRRRRLVLGIVAAAVLLGAGLTLAQPQSYTARTMLVLLQGGRRTGLSAQLPAQLAMPTLGLFGSDPNQKLIDVILGSVALQDSMVSAVRRARPDQPEIEATVREILDDGTQTRSNSDGSILITVAHRDPELARLMADKFPELINELSAHVNAQSARNRRDFVESQLTGARANLEEAEERLAAYQRQGRAPEVTEQARQTMEVAGGLQARIMEQEGKVAELRRTRTEDHPELRSAIAQLEGLRRQMRSLESGAGGGFFPSLRESPDLMLNSARLLREYKKAEQVYVSLTAALAEAQIQANENLAAVGVLDRAQPSSNPRWVLILRNLVVSAVLGLIAGVMAAFVADYVARARMDPGNARFFAAWDELKDDLVPGRRRRRRVSGAGA
ncbi:MAG: hypothetical protein KY467_03925 [Gemmatimonadetes bacterium]|nr:hypothetical protein [Gemmatimonadota bacterium]